jgi:hypothetical protein
VFEQRIYFVCAVEQAVLRVNVQMDETHGPRHLNPPALSRGDAPKAAGPVGTRPPVAAGPRAVQSYPVDAPGAHRPGQWQADVYQPAPSLAPASAAGVAPSAAASGAASVTAAGAAASATVGGSTDTTA